MSVATHYRRIRRDRPTEPASRAIFWARNMDKIDRLASRTEWEWTGDYTGAFLIGRVDGIEIRVYNDAEPYDSGDCELTDQEWRDLEVIGVAVGIPHDPDDLDSIWGVAYLDHDAERNALETAHETGLIATARDELERRRTRAEVRGEN